jgi:hypothetical protein
VGTDYRSYFLSISRDPRKIQPMWHVILYLPCSRRDLLSLLYTSRSDVLMTFEGYCLGEQVGATQLWANSEYFISSKVAEPLTSIWINKIICHTRFGVNGLRSLISPGNRWYLTKSLYRMPLNARMFPSMFIQKRWAQQIHRIMLCPGGQVSRWIKHGSFQSFFPPRERNMKMQIPGHQARHYYTSVYRREHAHRSEVHWFNAFCAV